MVTHTYTHTHTHDNYYNPRCAHAHRGLMKRQRSLSSYFQDECIQTRRKDVVRDSDNLEESSTTSATPPSDDATSMSQEVRTCSSSDLMGSSASKSPRIDWKPSWKDRYLVDFNRESQEMICMVCHLRMRCVRIVTQLTSTLVEFIRILGCILWRNGERFS